MFHNGQIESEESAAVETIQRFAGWVRQGGLVRRAHRIPYAAGDDHMAKRPASPGCQGGGANA
jgi:hypothetical protein